MQTRVSKCLGCFGNKKITKYLGVINDKENKFIKRETVTEIICRLSMTKIQVFLNVMSEF